MRLLQTTWLPVVLAVVPRASAYGHPLEAAVEEGQIARRDAQFGESCGLQGGGVSCAAGLCCSEDVKSPRAPEYCPCWVKLLRICLADELRSPKGSMRFWRILLHVSRMPDEFLHRV